MRRSYLIFAAACVLAFPGALPVSGEIPGAPPDLLARVHFAGASQLAANPEAATLRSVWTLPESRKLVQETLDKLARAPEALFRTRLDPIPGDRSELCRPFFEDFLSSESFAEIRLRPDKSLEWTLAVRLADERAALWQSNLTALVSLWKVGTVAECKVEELKGWEVVKHHEPNTIRWVRSGSWFVLGLGQNTVPNLVEILREIKQNGHPQGTEREGWLSLQLDCPRLAQAGFPLPHAGFLSGSLPALQLHLGNKADNVRTRLSLHFAEPHTWALEPWRIPAHTFGDPMISFTAIQGFSPWLKNWPFLGRVGINPVPNQLFIWAQPQVQFQTFFVAPVQHVTNVLERMGAVLPSLVASNFFPNKLGEVRVSTNKTDIVWTGLPIIAPFLCAAPEPSGEFLLAGFFPSQLNTNPPPAELLAQISSRTNLLYYDWEITQDRLWQVRILSTWYDLLSPGKSEPPPLTKNGRVEPPPVAGAYTPSDIVDPQSLGDRLRRHSDKLSQYLWSRFSEPARQAIQGQNGTLLASKPMQVVLAEELNAIIQRELVYEKQRFEQVSLSARTQGFIGQKVQGESLVQLNRMLLAEAYPQQLANGPWLVAIGPKLGNTVTELSVASPRELDLVRKSGSGFSSLELVILNRWLDDPRFPLFGFTLSPHPRGGRTGKADEKP
jgi:hypothetical protein